MTVYVDELRVWGDGRVATSHLTADSIDELRAFVCAHGIPERCWHAGARVPHYDVPERWRSVALEAGAMFVPARDQAKARMARRKDTPGRPGS